MLAHSFLPLGSSILSFGMCLTQGSITIYSVSSLHLQALRYSYFYVGQALGTPQQILEQGRPQPGPLPTQPLPPPQQQLQQQPLLLKPVPPPQPGPPNQHCSPSRPLQQIQPATALAPTLNPAPVYQRHTELLREQPTRTVKQEETERAPQTRFPYIVDKGIQSQVSFHQSNW